MAEATTVAADPLPGVSPAAIPRHIAIIMDGNGRWARLRNRPRIWGHRQGARRVRPVVLECDRLGVRYLTLYSFSVENWKRPALEVNALMALYARYLRAERRELHANDVRVLQIGARDGLPERVLRELDETAEMTRNNRGLTLCLALNYGSRDELVRAMRRLAEDVRAGRLAPDEIDERRISDSLYTAGIPDPDLVIRTAGEHRISNFLLWQISYSELHVCNTLWPEFGAEQLHEAIRSYASRERRFGDIKSPGSTA